MHHQRGCSCVTSANNVLHLHRQRLFAEEDIRRWWLCDHLRRAEGGEDVCAWHLCSVFFSFACKCRGRSGRRRVCSNVVVCLCGLWWSVAVEWICACGVADAVLVCCGYHKLHTLREKLYTPLEDLALIERGGWGSGGINYCLLRRERRERKLRRKRKRKRRSVWRVIRGVEMDKEWKGKDERNMEFEFEAKELIMEANYNSILCNIIRMR